MHIIKVKVLFVLLFVGLAFGSNWYISPFGNNNNSGTSQGSPLADLKTALNKASQGDTIFVATGTYSGVNNVGLSVTGINIIGTSGSVSTVFQGQSSTISIFKLLAGATLQGVTVATGTNGVEVFGNSTTLIDIYATSTTYGILLNLIESISITKLKVSGTVSIGIGLTSTSTVETISISNSNFYAKTGILYNGAGVLTSVNITNCVFQSQTVNSKGIIFDLSSSAAPFNFYLTNSTFLDYYVVSSSISGAAVYFTVFAASNVTITSCTFSNIFASNGPTIYAYGLYSLSISHTSVTNSSSTRNGGAFYMQSIQNVSILNSNFQSCSTQGVSYSGGAIFFSSSIGNVFISNTTFGNSTSNGTGGALFFVSGSQVVFIDFCIFNNSYADGGGGAIYSQGLFTINNTIFANNYVKKATEINGGAIYYSYTRGSNVSYILYSYFYNNTAYSGGAVYVSDGLLTFNNGTFAYNVAQSYGGALYVVGATVSLYETVFQYNIAKGSYGGGAYFVSSASVNLASSGFVGNVATSSGGGFYCASSAGVLLNAVVFSANSAPTGSGYTCSSQCLVTGTSVYFYNGDSASCAPLLQ